MAGIAILMVCSFVGADDVGWRSKYQPSARPLEPSEVRVDAPMVAPAPNARQPQAGAGAVLPVSAYDPIPSADEMVDRAEAALRSELGGQFDAAADAVRRELESRGITPNQSARPNSAVNPRPATSPPGSSPALPPITANSRSNTANTSNRSTSSSNWPEVSQVLSQPFDPRATTSSTTPGPGGRMRRETEIALPPIPPAQNTLPPISRTAEGNVAPRSSGQGRLQNTSTGSGNAGTASRSASRTGSLQDWLEGTDQVAPPGSHLDLPPLDPVVTDRGAGAWDDRRSPTSASGDSLGQDSRRNAARPAAPPATGPAPRTAEEFDRWAADVRRGTVEMPAAERGRAAEGSTGFPSTSGNWGDRDSGRDNRASSVLYDDRLAEGELGNRQYVRPPARDDFRNSLDDPDVVPVPRRELDAPFSPSDNRSPVPTGPPSEQGAATAEDPAAASNPPSDRPWGPLVLAVLALFGSIGFNLYLGWIAWDLYTRYQDAMEDVHELESKLEEKQLERVLV